MRLLPHAGPGGVRSLEAGAARGGVGLQVSYRLEADLSALRIPSPAGVVRADGLWRHTCLEAFVGAPGSPAYVEFNFAPSGAWAAYAFDGYRSGMRPLPLAAPPGARWTRATDHLVLDATLPLDGAGLAGGPLRVALAAVIEDDAGRIGYWALAHPPGAPDFHHDAGFVLALAA